MKRQLRKGVFETNSSSTHTLTIFKKDAWENYKNGEDVFYNIWETTFVTKNEIENSKDYKEYIKECVPDFENMDKEEKDDAFSDYLMDEGLMVYDDLYGEYEILEKETPDGTHVAVSLYSPN